MPETNPNGGVPETSASTVPSDDVSEASQTTPTTEASDPMAMAPAEPTEAQKDQAGVQDKPSEESLRQVREDADWRSDNPGKVLIREANPEVGGESFDYLKYVSG